MTGIRTGPPPIVFMLVLVKMETWVMAQRCRGEMDGEEAGCTNASLKGGMTEEH